MYIYETLFDKNKKKLYHLGRDVGHDFKINADDVFPFKNQNGTIIAEKVCIWRIEIFEKENDRLYIDYMKLESHEDRKI